MTVSLDVGQLVTVVVAAVVMQGAATAVTFVVFRAQASEWHKANQFRFGRIEKALGIDDPDDVAFIRRSEAQVHLDEADREKDRVWEKLQNHEGRIQKIETK